jgi:hypothetical protein
MKIPSGTVSSEESQTTKLTIRAISSCIFVVEGTIMESTSWAPEVYHFAQSKASQFMPLACLFLGDESLGPLD